jgi:hypothetical protein
MSGTGTTSRRVIPAAALPVAVAAVPLVAYGFGSLIGWGARSAGGWLAVWASVLAAATAGASLLSAAAREPDKTRRDSWYWFAAGAAAWSAGVAVHAVSRLVSSSSVVALSFADLFFLTALFGLGGGLVSPIRPPRALGAWLRFAADTYICAVTLVVSAWIVGLGSLYRLSG